MLDRLHGELLSPDTQHNKEVAPFEIVDLFRLDIVLLGAIDQPGTGRSRRCELHL